MRIAPYMGDGGVDHVGIEKSYENRIVYTVEGNSGNQCKGKSDAIGSG